MLRGRLALLLAVLVLPTGLAVAAVRVRGGDVGPRTRITPNGRHLTPPGRLVSIGNFPTGGAATADGRWYWTISTGRARNDIEIVSVRSGKVIQRLPLPGASGGIAIDSRRRLAYVSGVHDTEDPRYAVTGVPGRQGDVVHVLAYDGASGRATYRATISVPPPAGSPDLQDFPPTSGKHASWPDRLALSPGGDTLLVPLNLADRAAIVDTATKTVRYVATGSHPYGAAILRDGRTGLVTNEVPGTVSVIDLVSGTKTKDITAGARISHPEAIALDPKADRAYVAVANSDQIAVLDTKRLVLERTLSVGRPEGLGTTPIDVTVTPRGDRLLAALAGSDEIAVFGLPTERGGQAAAPAGDRAAAILDHEARRAAERAARLGAAGEEEGEGEGAGAGAARARFPLLGRIPTAAYPSDVEATRDGRVLWISASGFGQGPSDVAGSRTRYRGTAYNDFGKAGILPLPGERGLRALTRRADRQVRPVSPDRRPKDTPLRKDGPIDHVFYIVRENRTYDQVLGDLGRGDGDPKLALFGKRITPNAHRLARRFPLLDRVFANSEASIDGHFWTSAAAVSDYVEKNWHQNYADRGRPYDFGVYTVTWPGGGFLFDQAEQQRIPYYNFGEAIAGVVGGPLSGLDRDMTPALAKRVNAKLARSDLGKNPVGIPGCFATSAFIGDNPFTGNPAYDSSIPPGAPAASESRFDCFRKKFRSWVAKGTVPRFVYLTPPDDHTNGTKPGARTPNGMVADNDWALGQFVDEISHSKIWKHSAIFVIEDDSQDGPDHVDAHRIPAFVISPYTRPGAIVSNRYDFLSVIRSIELITGLRPLGLFDRLATPMYAAFTGKPTNAKPYDAVVPKVDMAARNPASAAAARLARRYDLRRTDRVPQRVLDRMLWQATHGPEAEPPPPGPNNVPGG